MTHRNLLLLGLSSIALQGCIAAAAIPIVAGSGAIVRDSVSDDARSASRESVAVVPITPPAPVAPGPAPMPTPAPTPALAAAEPAEPVSVAAEPVVPPPAPEAEATAAPATLATPAPILAEPVFTAADPSLPSNAVVVMTLPQDWEEPAPPTPEPAPAPASEELASAAVPETPVATAVEPAEPAEPIADPTPAPPPASIAEVGLPPEPVAAEPEPAPEPALAITPASEEPVAAEPALPAPVELAAVEPPQPSLPEPVAAAAPAVVPQPAPEPVAQPAAEPAAELAPVQAPEIAPAPVQAPEPAPVTEALVAAEPPIEPPAPVSVATLPGQPMGEGYGALRSYALATLGGGLPLPSAILADPTSLQPIRRQCQGNTPTVLIDLDPAGGLVPLAGPLALNSDLGRILDELRMRDVQIAWITDRGPIDARRVRDRLVAAGLDPDSQDALYVERYPGETKQARRAALAQTQCVIALAGDERSDFDDLYNYIIDPDDARSLDPLLGNGWFLIDNPVGQ